MKTEKTFRMPKELLKKWVAALRSGKYKQGKGCLGNAKRGYCCLGLLTRVADGRVERSTLSLPSSGWCNDHNVSLTGNYVGTEFDPQLFDAERQCWSPASDFNDLEDYTFEQIADLVEKHGEGI